VGKARRSGFALVFVCLAAAALMAWPLLRTRAWRPPILRAVERVGDAANPQPWQYAFSADGETIFEARRDGVALWSASEVAAGRARRVALLPASSDYASWGAKLDARGQRLVYSRGEELGVAQILSASLVEKRLGGEGPFYIAVEADGRRALVAPQGGASYPRLWDLERGVEIARLDTDAAGAFVSLAFSPDGRRALTGSHERIVVWDLSTPTPRALIAFTGSTYGSFAPDGRLLAFASGRRTVAISDVETGFGHDLDLGHEGAFIWKAIDLGDGRHMLGLGSQELVVLDLVRERVVSHHPYPAGEDIGFPVATASPDGRGVVVGGRKGELFWLDLAPE